MIKKNWKLKPKTVDRIKTIWHTRHKINRHQWNITHKDLEKKFGIPKKVIRRILENS